MPLSRFSDCLKTGNRICKVLGRHVAISCKLVIGTRASRLSASRFNHQFDSVSFPIRFMMVHEADCVLEIFGSSWEFFTDDRFLPRQQLTPYTPHSSTSSLIIATLSRRKRKLIPPISSPAIPRALRSLPASPVRRSEPASRSGHYLAKRSRSRSKAQRL